jgi:hypothetical protein
LAHLGKPLEDNKLNNWVAPEPVWHARCLTKGVVGRMGRSAGLYNPTSVISGPQSARHITPWRFRMRWTKPEAEVVAVTMEVTAYVATL